MQHDVKMYIYKMRRSRIYVRPYAILFCIVLSCFGFVRFGVCLCCVREGLRLSLTFRVPGRRAHSQGRDDWNLALGSGFAGPHRRLPTN